MEILIGLGIGGLLVALLVMALIGERKKDNIICPNPNCGYRGRGKRIGGQSGCLLVILLCLGIIPGLIYMMFSGASGIQCPRCGMRVR